jgi:hypothetical protein
MKKILSPQLKALATGTSALCLMGSVASADIVHLDDVIIDGSLCVGFDCVNGESFGFDTIRMKENNIRIKAQDTSSSASFPSNDWQITFNDSANGGLNKFSIDDIDGGRTPFTIEANAPSHSLYVDDGGRLGLGTSTPVVDIHAKSGNTPTLRLEQDGSNGFTPQTWDVAGNEAGFFIRDATNGSTLPFRIRPGAPSSAIDIAADGDVGVGTTSPDAGMHVVDATNALLVDKTDGGAAEAFAHFRTKDGTAPVAAVLIEDNSSTAGVRRMLELKNNGGSFISLTNTAASDNRWNIIHENNAPNRLILSNSGDADSEFILDDSGNVTLTGTITTVGGSCGAGCDRVFTADYDLPSIETHASQMWSKGFLPNVGPTIENTPINVSDKMGRMLNELEHAHIYIDQMNQRIAVLEESLTKLQ